MKNSSEQQMSLFEPTSEKMDYTFKGICALFYLERRDVFSFKKNGEKFVIVSKEYNENGSSFLYYKPLDDSGERSFEMTEKGRKNNVCWWVMYSR